MKKSKYLIRLTSLRDEWSNEIPKEVKDSTDKDKKYKVRNVWFGIAYLLIDAGIDYNFVDQQSTDMYKQFVQYTKDTNFHYRLKTKQDINKMDSLLTDIIYKLENQK